MGCWCGWIFEITPATMPTPTWYTCAILRTLSIAAKLWSDFSGAQETQAAKRVAPHYLWAKLCARRRRSRWRLWSRTLCHQRQRHATASLVSSFSRVPWYDVVKWCLNDGSRINDGYRMRVGSWYTIPFWYPSMASDSPLKITNSNGN